MTIQRFTLPFLLLIFFNISIAASTAGKQQAIKIETDNTSLILKVGKDDRLYQAYLGQRLSFDDDIDKLGTGLEAYLTHGLEDYFEPALHVEHPDHNHSTLLKYVSHTCETNPDGSVVTTINLSDDKYPLEVKLRYTSYPHQDVIVANSEIINLDKRPIVLHRYASSLLSFFRQNYYLTEYSGDWASEAAMSETKLNFGKKILDTKLGARHCMFLQEFFQLSFDKPASETQGEVLVGTLAWTGNFRYTFEVDQKHNLRVISGINPYFSQYTLPGKQTFKTPDFIFTYSNCGKGKASRNLHSWARQHRIKDGTGDRLTILNNWEATYFDFNEEKLTHLMDDATKLGVDMFLLDDGWFGNKYPRNSDTQGLGDWQENKAKLPHKLSFLADEAERRGIKFGVWVEPEMVNPKSELYEKHKDWVITLPNRTEYYFRNQLVLDLANPKVQDFVFGVIDNMLTECPKIAFLKWDCNSPITNIYSNYLHDKQTHLYVDYVRGLYNVLSRIKTKYPKLRMMLCSGGGGRADYEALQYYTEFWPSDNTDPIERLYIQWGYSSVFPSKVMCSHVTTWNKDANIKFKVDVASMGKLGFDIKLSDISEQDLKFCRQAVENYNSMKPTILDGDMYRLVSPYDGNHTASMFVSGDRSNATVFAFDIHPRYNEHTTPLLLQGLKPDAKYSVTEINRYNADDEMIGKYSGQYLMTVGINAFSSSSLRSHVYMVKELK